MQTGKQGGRRKPKEKNAQMEKRIKFLEEGFYSSKFSWKVTHIFATTLQLLAQEKDEVGLDMEDTKFLYKFLAKDWTKVFLARKGKQKDEK